MQREAEPWRHCRSDGGWPGLDMAMPFLGRASTVVAVDTSPVVDTRPVPVAE